MISTRQRFRTLGCAAFGAPPWQPIVPPTSARLPSSCDVLIAGGGLTGLFLAQTLAARGRDTVVIESRFGGGATARSGGVVLGGTAAGPSPSFDGCEEGLRSWIASRRVECGLAWEGCLELVRSAQLSPEPIDWHDGGPVRLSSVVNGGVLDPARLLQAALRHAVLAGVRLVDNVTVEAFEATSSLVSVQTSAGATTSPHLVMATDAMLTAAAAAPWVERGITVAIQTEPLGSSALAAIGLGPCAAFYTDDLPLLWGRVMVDDSLLIGRELLPHTVDFPPQWLSAAIARAGDRLLARARGLHPVLRAIGLVKAWGGPIVSTRSGVPLAEPDPSCPRVIWAGGYGGHGIAQAFRVAELIANRLTAHG